MTCLGNLPDLGPDPPLCGLSFPYVPLGTVLKGDIGRDVPSSCLSEQEVTSRENMPRFPGSYTTPAPANTFPVFNKNFQADRLY